MEKTLRKLLAHEDTRSETYRDWRSRPDWEIFEETSKMSRDAYREYYERLGIVFDECTAKAFIRIKRDIR